MESLEVKKKKVGQLLIAGFEGTTVTSNIREMIETYHISTIILSSKNFINGQQTKQLIYELQYTARQAGYEHPIMFAIDQEGGMVASLFDENYITQFPGLMGLSLTSSPELIYEIYKAMALELRSIGFVIILGPVLDIVTKFSHQLIGVRSFGSTVEEVIKYGSLLLRGLRDGGMLTFGKHFPGLNNAEISSLLELPMLTETLEQIEKSNVLTFKALMDLDLLDGLELSGALVPNISPNEFHACLSTVIMDDLLRQKLHFDGVVISECLEMEVLFSNLGFKQGVIMALFATCDLIMVCHNHALQVELVHALIQAIDDGILAESLIDQSLRRIRKLQRKLPTWDATFNIPDITLEQRLRHLELSQLAYKKTITLVRDYNNCLPITKFFKDQDYMPDNNGLLLLTPIITPLYSKSGPSEQKYFPGEENFQEFGKFLSSYSNEKANFKVYHTSYTANGLTSLHEKLIEKCKVVILVTSETSRNLHQIGIAKYISVLCGGSSTKAPTRKPLIIVAVSSPYDFYYSKNIGSVYLCTYDYTDNALAKLAEVLVGEYNPVGCIPGEFPKHSTRKDELLLKRKRDSTPQRRWLVDEFNIKRDWKGFVTLCMGSLLTANDKSGSVSADIVGSTDLDDILSPEKIELIEKPKDEKSLKRMLIKVFRLLHDTANEQKHFVVRNSSLNTLYGVILTWYNERLQTGSIIYILVDASKRGQAIGQSLHAKAFKYLTSEKQCKKVTLGTSFPLLNIPDKSLFQYLQQNEQVLEDPDIGLIGENPLVSFLMDKEVWTFDKFRKHHLEFENINYVLQLENLKNWSVSKKLVRQLQVVGIMFDICQNLDEVTQLIKTYHWNHPSLYELYQEAAKCDPGSLKVIVALEPTNKSVVGSIIVFTNESPISKFYPFLEEYGGNVGGLSGLIIDPSYENLTDVFKLGLVCTSLSYLKKQSENLDKCLLIGINKSSNNINNFKDNGFKVHKQYYHFYDEKDCL